MRARDEVAYRLALADGFLVEAEQDMELERWRSCVDNAQLVVENAGKAVLAWFGAVPKTHDPAQQIAAVLRTQALPGAVEEALRRMLPDLLALGIGRAFSDRLWRRSDVHTTVGSICARVSRGGIGSSSTLD